MWDKLYTLIAENAAGDVLRAWLERCSTPDRPPEAMAVAASCGTCESVDALLDLGWSPSQSDGFGVTPLMVAAESGRTKMIGHLLRRGAHIEARDSYGQTALFYAARAEGAEEAVNVLLEAGATRDVVDDQGISFEQYAATQSFGFRLGTWDIGGRFRRK